METYFKIKLLMEQIIPFVITAPIVTIFIICFIAKEIKLHRIKKFMTDNGYERHYIATDDITHQKYYSYRRMSDHKIIRENELSGMKFKDIVSKYK